MISALPVGWRVERLLDLVSIRSGQVDPKLAQYRDLPLIAPDHIESGTGRLLDVRSAREQGAISGKFLVDPGDIIYSKIRPYLMKAYRAEFPALCSADMYPLKPRRGADGRYVLNVLLGREFTNYAVGESMRSGIPKINREGLAGYELPVPADSEQATVGAALGDADALIQSIEQAIAKKRALKQGMMQELLTGRTRLSGFDGEWEDVSAGDTGVFKGGSGFPTRFQGLRGQRYPFFKVSDMNNLGNETYMRSSNNSVSELMRSQLGATAFPAGSIVFAKVGAAVFLERKRILAEPSCIDNNMAAFTANATWVDSLFMYYVLQNVLLGSLVAVGALPALRS
ncbi:MAG: hypothetical protein B7X41_04500 [Microbacterium sp. 14-71-5]|nr:MAG: hypothetical protein B7X41_04500 [Microbacterium sp. 14-71-5]